ncbi:thioredoxin family protein [Mucilaginibacter sp. UR6-11]|uniref:thioredoxin family protein n=1 Tax=Mucilaginibacter sp. UR6-11 TaxID=1435644 RepID=UPI001E5DFD43|nr:thioredoxin family protein [Mucilaginibacter sp. UR6-11]MCC8423701.1 thioredoxin family protein [Mucilaginibacter sp. UR6-11]
MKLFIISLFISLITNITWLGDFNEATHEAAKSHKLILINFSGSDWCGPCIRERKEILENEVFENYAADHLILVRADFPRQKKNQLTKEQTRLNEALADKYNPDGKFPYTLLVDEHGKVLKDWDGFPNESPEKFVAQIAAVINGTK